jgi:hypothetical protein
MEKEFKIVLEGTYKAGKRIHLPTTKRNKKNRLSLISRLLKRKT